MRKYAEYFVCGAQVTASRIRTPSNSTPQPGRRPLDMMVWYPWRPMRILLPFFAASAALFAQGNADWHREFPAFKIAGDLYYVGTADLAVYLVNTPRGNILINTDFKQDVPAVRKSIEQLGFKYSETRILLISHAHGDHDEATGLVAKETGAKLMVMDADVPE